MNSRLRVGIVGTGIFARDGHLPVYEAHKDKFEVVAVYNRTKAKALEFAQAANVPEDHVYDSLEEMLADPNVDVIDALLPVEMNAEVARKCIAAGKPVLLEKPIAATLEQAREVVKTASQTSLPLAIGENWLYLDCIKVARNNLDRIGRVAGFTHNSTGPFVSKNKYLATGWRQHPKHIGGFLSDGGVHQLALVMGILGDFKSVNAHTSQVRQESGSTDTVFAITELRCCPVNGTFTYSSAFGQTDKSVYLKIYGTKGSICIDLSDKKNVVVKIRIGEFAESKHEEEIIKIKEDASFGVEKELLNFHEAVVAKDKSLLISTPEKAFQHLSCVSAFLESSQQNGAQIEVAKP